MSPAEPRILVKIPDRCYISPQSSRPFPFPFSFVVRYGVIPSRQVEKAAAANAPLEAVKGPTITISGFEKLLSLDRLGEFLRDLKKTGDKAWAVSKSPYNEIVFTYAGDSPDPDFWFSASTEKFVSDARGNETVVLRVAVRGFDVPDVDYNVSTKVDYTPWAKSITLPRYPVPLNSTVEVFYDYMGDNVDKHLLQDGQVVQTARSPYTAIIEKPSRFTLEVFNQSGVLDRIQAEVKTEPPKVQSFKPDRDYFAKGEAVTLTWELHSASTFTIENLKEDEEITESNRIVVHPQTPPGSVSASYTLRANGFEGDKPTSVTKTVTLTRTRWKNARPATGFFSGDVYGNVKYNSRIVNHGGQHFCYAHPVLYKSANGSTWTSHSVNGQAPDSFRCLTADVYKNILYAMGKEGEQGNRLYICQFDFSSSKWSYESASQFWASDIGGFSFSKGEAKYAQTVQRGITLALRGEDGGWDAGTSVILAEENAKVIGGDYCFFKDRHYAVMLCEDNHIYVYDCSEAMQSVLFRRYVGENGGFACFVQTISHLYVMTGGTLTNVKTQEHADAFFPQKDGSAGRPWLGVNSQDIIFGVFSDKNVWEFEE